jgi:hypothetical protein
MMVINGRLSLRRMGVAECFSLSRIQALTLTPSNESIRIDGKE